MNALPVWIKMVQVNAMPNKGQLMAEQVVKTEAEGQTDLKTWTTHPLTVDRLSAIALYLKDWARRAGSGNQHDVLAYIATKLAYMAEGLGDPDLQGCRAVVAHRADPTTLMPRRIGAVIGGELMQALCEKRR
jgi:hypothetical protein